MVLLKGYDERGFMFYTNYDSRKAHELANGRAAICMYWEPLQRQVLFQAILNIFHLGALSLLLYLCPIINRAASHMMC